MKKLTDLQISDLTQGLAMLLHSGIPLSESLFLLSQEEGAGKILLETISRRTEQGSHLWSAMESSGAFSPYICSLVRIGEETGQLEDALNSISAYCLERCQISARLRSALTYPGIILVMMLGVIGVLLVQVLPIFNRVYASLGSGLTGIPAALLAFGQFLSQASPWLLGFLLLLAAVITVIFLVPSLRQGCVRLFQRSFGDRWIFQKIQNARFARGLAMGLSSGLTLENAMDLACGLVSHVPGTRSRAQNCAAALSLGDSLADALGSNKLLPPSACRILAAGIRSGNTDRCMDEIAHRLRDDAADSLDTLLSRIEPTMVLTAAILVGLILLSVMLPLLNIMNALG